MSLLTISAGLPNNINVWWTVSDESTVTLMPEPPFFVAPSVPTFVATFVAASAAVGGVPHRYGPETGPENTSLDEERREVLASVLGALAGTPPDPDKMAACRHLLKHLAQTAGR